jgi:hypothetical protein
MKIRRAVSFYGIGLSWVSSFLASCVVYVAFAKYDLGALEVFLAIGPWVVILWLLAIACFAVGRPKHLLTIAGLVMSVLIASFLLLFLP